MLRHGSIATQNRTWKLIAIFSRLSEVQTFDGRFQQKFKEEVFQLTIENLSTWTEHEIVKNERETCRCRAHVKICGAVNIILPHLMLSISTLSIYSIYLLSNLYICILLHHLPTLCLPIPKFLYQSHSTPSIYLLSVYIYLRLYTNLLLSLLYLCCIQPITMYVHNTLLYIIYLHYFTYTSVFVPI